jgi:hypothetical protein
MDMLRVCRGRIVGIDQTVLTDRAGAACPMETGTDTLIDAVWDGERPAGSAMMVRSVVMRLRRALGPGSSIYPVIPRAIDARDSIGPAVPVPGAITGGTVQILSPTDFAQLDPVSVVGVRSGFIGVSHRFVP